MMTNSNLNLIVRELEAVQEGLKALETRLQTGDGSETMPIVENLLASVAQLIGRCKARPKALVTLPGQMVERF